MIGVLRNGQRTVYHCPRICHLLDGVLFWGPEIALEFFDHEIPDEYDRWGPWYDFCGGAAIDRDKKRLSFFASSDINYDIPLRRAYLALMRENWPGWTTGWEIDEIAGICEFLGVPVSRIGLPASLNPHEHFRSEFWSQGYLLTVCRNVVSAAYQVDGHTESLLLGPEHLQVLDEIEPTSSLVWTGEFPRAGGHIDFDTMQLAWWDADMAVGTDGYDGDNWSGWSVTCLEDQFERHLALADLDIRLPERPAADLQRSILMQMAGRMGDLRRANGGVYKELLPFRHDRMIAATLEKLEKRIPVGA